MTDSRTVHMPSGIPAPEVMTPKDVVEFLQIETTNATPTVRRLAKKGLRTKRIANEVRCLLSDVLAFVETQVETNEAARASNNDNAMEGTT